MIADEEAKKRIVNYLMKKIDAQFYGKAIIIFQSGKVTHIIEEKSLKLESMKN